MLLSLFPILRWADPIFFSEHPTEVKLIVITHNLCNLADFIIGILQQALRIDHPKRQDVLRRAYFHILLKVSDEPVRADVQRFCIVLHADFGVVVLVEVGNGGFDLLRNVYLHTFAFLLLAADKKQNRVEHRGNVVLIAILALLQLPDDFSEQHLILRQSSAVKDVLIQWDAVIGQNVLYIIASEMNHLIVGQFSRTDQKAFQHGCKGGAHALSGSAPTSDVQGSFPGAGKSAASVPLWLFHCGDRQGRF